MLKRLLIFGVLTVLIVAPALITTPAFAEAPNNPGCVGGFYSTAPAEAVGPATSDNAQRLGRERGENVSGNAHYRGDEAQLCTWRTV